MNYLWQKMKRLLRGNHRDFLLKIMPKNSIIAEIGVYKGDFSKKILHFVNPRKLHLIDPWKYETEEIYTESLYGGDQGIDQVNLENIYNSVVNRFANEIKNGNVMIHRLASEQACKQFQENYFDWIYIDGNHKYEFVKNDLEYYYPKVKNGGFITGDDYTEGGWWQGGVKKAVDEFISKGLVKVISLKDEQFILRKI